MLEESKNTSRISCFKTQSIDKHFDELEYNTFSTTSSNDTNNSLLHHHDIEDNYEERKEEIENLYGYEPAAPTELSSSSKSMPRRSSLSDSSSKSRQRRRATIGYRDEMVLVLPTGKKTRKRSSIGFKEDNKDTGSTSEPTSTTTTSNYKNVEYDYDYEYDPSQLWFQRDEYQHINEDVRKIIVESKSSSKSFQQKVDTGLCTRGLEPVLYGSTTKEEREQAKSCVLEEYAIQKSRNIYNGDAIRDIYSFFAIDSQIQATDRASHDEREIENYLKVTRNLHNRRSRRMSC